MPLMEGNTWCRQNVKIYDLFWKTYYVVDVVFTMTGLPWTANSITYVKIDSKEAIWSYKKISYLENVYSKLLQKRQ